MKKHLPIRQRLKVIGLLFLFGMSCGVLRAQNKQGNIWYFGYHAGVDFNTGSPLALSNGMLDTWEGCATMCNKAGNLLFYTDGITVFNRLHVAMPNGTGLSGGISSTQSALIVPKPGNPNVYYIFTVPQIGGPLDFKYSIVDITLDSGYGDIINKNTTILSGNFREKLAATYHSNGHDIWVVVHGGNNNAFYTYLITSTGISSPVISNTGSVFSTYSPAGYMKFSPSGEKVALALGDSVPHMDILDFDKSTGVFSNPVTFTLPSLFWSYGVEFSPTGSTLYLTVGNGIISSDIYQFNMNAGSPIAIVGSATIIHSTISGAALQLASDGKIYFAIDGTNWLGVINNPDSIGSLCNASDSGVFLGTGYNYSGLPNFISNTYRPVNYQNTCLNDTTTFSLPANSNLISAQWTFGDTASGVNNYSNLLNPSHYFYLPGIYMVQVIKNYASANDTTIISVTIYALPTVNLGSDTSFCVGSSYLLNADTGNISYLWQDGTTNSVLTATTAGTYIVTVTDNGCLATDTVVLTTNPCNPPTINLSSTDTNLCEKQCVDFFDLSTNNPTSWQWFFPGADSTTSTMQNPTNICYSNYGSFDVTLIACNAAGCDTLVLPNFINEYPAPTPTITQSNDTLFSSPGVAYQWWSVDSGIITGANNYYYIPTQAGSYFVIVTDTTGCEGASNTIVITGIEEAIDNKQIAIVPNPNDGSFTIALTSSITKDFSLRITNPLGQTIFNKQGAIGNGQQVVDVNMNDAAKGLYLVEVVNGGKVYRGKLMVW